MHGKGRRFSLLYQRSSCAPFRSDIESPLLSPSRCPCTRARALQSIPSGKKSSRAKVCIRARSEEMREERARYLADEGKGRETGEQTALAYETRQRAPLRRKVKAPVKDVRRNVRSVCRNARDTFPPLSCRFSPIVFRARFDDSCSDHCCFF